MSEPVLLSVTDAAEMLSCSEDTVRRLIADGVLPEVRVRQRVLRIPRAAIDAYIAEQTNGATRKRKS